MDKALCVQNKDITDASPGDDKLGVRGEVAEMPTEIADGAIKRLVIQSGVIAGAPQRLGAALPGANIIGVLVEVLHQPGLVGRQLQPLPVKKKG